MPSKLFFTGGGGAGTIEAVKSLKALGYEIVTADATPTPAGFSWADRSCVIPFGVDDGFVPALREIVRREQPDVQLILDGTPRVIEINPRYSTTMALTLASGVNEVDA